MADVRGEARLALDAGLDRIGHVVERPGEPVEVGIGFGGETCVESARGDVGGGVGDLAERPEQATARGESEQGGQDHRAQRTQQQSGQDRRQRRLRLRQRKRLEVARVVLRDVHADGDVVGAVDGCVLECAGAGADAVDESLGEVGDRVQHAGARSGRRWVVRAEHGEAVVDGAQLVVEEHADPGGIQGQLLADEVGVGEGLLLCTVAVLVEQVVAGQPVGDTDQDDAGEQCDEREEQRDPCSQAEGSAPGHRVSVAGGGHPRPSDAATRTSEYFGEGFTRCRWNARGRKASHRGSVNSDDDAPPV